MNDPAPVGNSRCPLYPPTAVGANITETLQLAPAASDDEQFVPLAEKPVPVTMPFVSGGVLNGTMPVLVNVELATTLLP